MPCGIHTVAELVTLKGFPLHVEKTRCSHQPTSLGSVCVNLPGTGSGPWKKAGLANTLRALDSIAALAPGLVHTLKPRTAAAPSGASLCTQLGALL